MRATRAIGWSVLLLAAGCAGAASSSADRACPEPPATPSACPEAPTSEPVRCEAGGVVVQVLGSGGPIADDARASAGYLVWVDGRARLLVDAGPGTLQTFARSGADVSDLEAVLISHLHVDHVADLVPLLKSASFGAREDPLPVIGPAGNDRFPPIDRFLETQLGDGAFGYLGGYLGEGQPFVLEPRVVDPSASESVEVLDTDGLSVRAVGVPHGPVPALGFGVRVQRHIVAFTGDQRMDDPRFGEMAEDAELLIAHLAISDDSDPIAARLHATPTQLGALAGRIDPAQVVLSHLMQRSLRHLDQARATIASAYGGRVTVASDGLCVAVE